MRPHSYAKWAQSPIHEPEEIWINRDTVIEKVCLTSAYCHSMIVKHWGGAAVSVVLEGPDDSSCTELK